MANDSDLQLSFIGDDLDNTVTQTWVPNALSLVQAVISPLISSASDTFQVRKWLLVGPCVISFIGSAIAPGSTDIYRLIVAQILIGFGFATVPLAYCVPSEILPRKWRPSRSSPNHSDIAGWEIDLKNSGTGWHERGSCSWCLHWTAHNWPSDKD